ncbi:MAG: DUF115 domain-containing protein [Nitrosarchaeum sp.]|nr:DUF115 domain-containing protein [Nitrosarchaeum sp.]
MVISGWELKYREILMEFKYDMKQDIESAKALDLIVKKPYSINKLEELIVGKPVIVVGAGPSLLHALPFLKKFKHITKIVADSAVDTIVGKKINPNIVVTDLDGDESYLKKIGKTDTVFVVHAHGDNIKRLNLTKHFKNCICSTQAEPFGKVQNFGGFTDGDRAVFLASYFNAKSIIMCGMDLEGKIGKFSHTKQSEFKVKLKKLQKAKELLEWLSTKSKSELFTTSYPITGFKKISYNDIDDIIT